MEYDWSDPWVRELLEGLDEPDDEPPPRGTVLPGGRYEPSSSEIACYEEMSARGSFRPLSQHNVPRAVPYHARGKWGRAIDSFKKDQPAK